MQSISLLKSINQSHIDAGECSPPPSLKIIVHSHRVVYVALGKKSAWHPLTGMNQQSLSLLGRNTGRSNVMQKYERVVC